jgi:GNAT superfamily N-acetyltransferase
MTRFAVREARPGDAEAIARAHTMSWQTSYRGILPDNVLDHIDVGQRAASRRKILADRSIFQLVGYDVTHGDIVGLCDAGPPRRGMPYGGEIYALYMVQHAKRYGLGQEMLERTQGWLAAQGKRSLIIWVLEANTYARGFYEAMGGQLGPRYRSTVGGFPVTEQAYVWDRF